MNEMMKFPYKKQTPDKEAKEASKREFQALIDDCFAAEKTAAEAGHAWKVLDIPDASAKAARILEYLEGLAHVITRNTGERPFERGGTTEENAEATGLDVEALRRGEIRFREPTERWEGFFDEPETKEEKKGEPATE